MQKSEVMAWLGENRDSRGMAHWDAKPRRLTSFGIGLTRLRKFAKTVGRDHSLALELWQSDYYDARVLGLLVDDPKQVTPEQAEKQVDELADGMLSHVFSSCDATLAKTKFAFELAVRWMDGGDPVRQRCGYGLLYELSKKNPKGMDDAFLLARIEIIHQTVHQQDMWVREAMMGALMGIGKRNKRLNEAAVRAARDIGSVNIDYGPDNQCEEVDVLKHLTSQSLKARLSR